MPVVGYEGKKPHIERVRKSLEWLRGIFKSIYGEDFNLAEETKNGEYPIVCIWQTYNPEGGDDGYGIMAYKPNPDGMAWSDKQFQAEFSKNTYFLHFPSVCEIDTRMAGEKQPLNRRKNRDRKSRK